MIIINFSTLKKHHSAFITCTLPPSHALGLIITKLTRSTSSVLLSRAFIPSRALPLTLLLPTLPNSLISHSRLTLLPPPRTHTHSPHHPHPHPLTLLTLSTPRSLHALPLYAPFPPKK